MVPRVTRILLTADETPASLATVRALRAAGHEPYAVVTREGTLVSRSRAVAGIDIVPSALDIESRARGIADVASRRGAEVVLPGTEATLRALTGREHLFAPGTIVGTPEPAALDLALDKGAVDRIAAAAGLDCLPCEEVSAADLDASAGRLSFPAVVKPRSSAVQSANGEVTLEGVHLADDVAAVRGVVERRPDMRWLVQRRVTGTLAAIGGVAWKGRLVCAVHQVSPRTWPPAAGITAFAVTVEPDREREQAVGRLLAEIGWSGLFGLQFLLAGGRAHPIDFNPRMYGSIGLAIASGPNLPAIWTDLLLGRDPVVAPSRAGTRYRVEDDDPRALLASWRAGDRGAAVRGLLPRRGTAHAILSARDPGPALGWVGDALRRAVRR
jgi:predicted ATP-grasp superfamily ATP-dependent carboligase